ncbi:BlaI/MecI/CopY family transcriptional regulator [Schlesneria paludicola]|uniref:BlaI/MecI/CopY family transcriptional regulator n=1 Tax=Schlesneria paludicola TaxID=360056 RepID=UPI00029B084D|nr:BlaI/MecI/CopY family transcriptional regulator [Schlesneria paludicola]
MARPQTGRPTDQELEILKVLWKRGRSSVRDVWLELRESREIGQTSVLKIMQIMRDKGQLVCDADQRPQIFWPKQTQKSTLKQLAGDLLQRVFGGSASLLLQHAIDSKQASRHELAEIRTLLDQLDDGKTPSK